MENKLEDFEQQLIHRKQEPLIILLEINNKGKK